MIGNVTRSDISYFYDLYQIKTMEIYIVICSRFKSKCLQNSPKSGKYVNDYLFYENVMNF